jgi:hypothetical protein
MEGKKGKAGIIRDSKGKFVPGHITNPNGRPKDTPEDKIRKKATKQLIQEYKDGLTGALSKIEPVLIAKAMEGDVPAMKEIHARSMGMPTQEVEHTGGIKIEISQQGAMKYVPNTTPSDDTERPAQVQGS